MHALTLNLHKCTHMPQALTVLNPEYVSTLQYILLMLVAQIGSLMVCPKGVSSSHLCNPKQVFADACLCIKFTKSKTFAFNICCIHKVSLCVFEPLEYMHVVMPRCNACICYNGLVHFAQILYMHDAQNLAGKISYHYCAHFCWR